MFVRFFRVFGRYARRHARIDLPGVALLDAGGGRFGQIDRITLQDGFLSVTGWALGRSVGLITPGESVHAAPALPRPDVAATCNLPETATPGFQLELVQASPVTFWAERDGMRWCFPLAPQVSRLRRWRAYMGRFLPFLRDLARAVPWVMRWYLRHEPHTLARALSILGLQTVTRLRRLDPALLAPQPASPGSAPDSDPAGRVAAALQAPVTIILPVYNAFDLLPEVLGRVLAHTDLPWRLVVIEDCSTDPQVRPWLRAWHAARPPAEAARIALLENDSNLGFIGSVNRGFAAARETGGHVVLLNSDALVPAGWAARLLRPMLDHPDVATVTPMSNDAEIFTVPVICRRNDLHPGEADAIDRAAAAFAPQAATAPAPTGVGFCMAIRAGFLDRVPAFDTGFGRGYGEEVDWCQKVRGLGGRHLGLTGLFVEHRGGVSFGSAEKLELVRRNNATISARYPGYDAEVQDFIRDDPLLTARLALGLAWAAARADTLAAAGDAGAGDEGAGAGDPAAMAEPGATLVAPRSGPAPVAVFLAHDLGGGADTYLKARLAGLLGQGRPAVVLRVGGPQARWQIELHSADGVVQGHSDDDALVARLIAILPARKIVYSCAVGDRDPLGLPGFLADLADGAPHRLEVLMHDYLPLSPSYTLLDSDGRYRGLPDARTNTDPAHQSRRPDGTRAGLAAWRAAWGRLMARADAITVFSEDSRRLVAAAYPDHAGRLRLRPHRLHTPVPSLVAPDGGGVRALRPASRVPVIGVLGDINHHKGAGVVQAMSHLLARSGAARLVHLGRIDPAFALAPPAVVHGRYKVDEIPALVREYGIGCWLIPSIWPETFSYTTHEALATGLPVWCFDLGAQADAVRAATGRAQPPDGDQPPRRQGPEAGRGGTIPLETALTDPAAVIEIILGRTADQAPAAAPGQDSRPAPAGAGLGS